MSFSELDRKKLIFSSLKERKNKVQIEENVPFLDTGSLSSENLSLIEQTAEAVQAAREKGAPVILAFGAHTIKNCLAPLLIRYIENNWITHIATNGAGIIHDWEFAYQGASSENVRQNVAAGTFGMWRETGLYINLAIAAGGLRGYGYGESVGQLIHSDSINLPSREELLSLGESVQEAPRTRAAALDLYAVIEENKLETGFIHIPHPYKQFSLQEAAFRLKVPFTGHPMFGHDIIYTHPVNMGSAVGRAAEVDFLRFADSVSKIEKGVYLSVGSAVMSPMIFEKSMSMAQNLARLHEEKIANHSIFVVDLAELNWDWESEGEPPPDNPAYYHRFCKTFSRMGGEMTYISMDNRNFLTALYRILSGSLR